MYFFCISNTLFRIYTGNESVKKISQLILKRIDKNRSLTQKHFVLVLIQFQDTVRSFLL